MIDGTDTAASAVDRRPLPARERWIFKSSARMLARTGVTPNMVSGAGLAVGVASGVALAATAWTDGETGQRVLWLIGVLLILLRGVCNILDGVIAVDTGQTSPVGLLYNEMPDRVSDAATMVGAGYALGGDPTLGWAAALVAVLVAYVRTQSRIAGAPHDYGGPMAKPMRMVVIAAAAGYLALTPSAWHAWWGPEDTWGIMTGALVVVIVGGMITAWRRVTRAARALRGAGP